MRRIVLLLASMALVVIFVSGVTLADSPTTKEHCKKGGWKDFGFKNKGQCIKAVLVGPPPPPPDLGKIVFSQGGCEGCMGARIWSMNPDGTNQQQVDLSATNVASSQNLVDPTLSPDGRKLAFVLSNTSPTSPNRLYVANVNSDLQVFGPLQLIDEANRIRNPSWSPDSNDLVYQKELDDFIRSIGIIVADLNSATKQTIARGIFANSPNWSSTNKIVFNQGTAGLVTINPDGTNATQVVGNAGRPDWSPDGSKLVYTAPRNAPPLTLGIYTSNADGSGETLVIGLFGGADAQPTWSPDGSKIAFSQFSQQNPDIYTISVDGTGLTNITNSTPTTSSGYELSPDWGIVATP